MPHPGANAPLLSIDWTQQAIHPPKRDIRFFILNMLEDIQKTLWATADKLRANMDAAE